MYPPLNDLFEVYRSTKKGIAHVIREEEFCSTYTPLFYYVAKLLILILSERSYLYWHDCQRLARTTEL